LLVGDPCLVIGADEFADALGEVEKELPEAERSLPPNWSRAVDEKDDNYYWHSQTRETQWDFPKGPTPSARLVSAADLEEARRYGESLGRLAGSSSEGGPQQEVVPKGRGFEVALRSRREAERDRPQEGIVPIPRRLITTNLRLTREAQREVRVARRRKIDIPHKVFVCRKTGKVRTIQEMQEDDWFKACARARKVHGGIYRSLEDRLERDREFLVQMLFRDQTEQYPELSSPKIQRLAERIARNKGLVKTALIAAHLRGATAFMSTCSAEDNPERAEGFAAFLCFMVLAVLFGVALGIVVIKWVGRKSTSNSSTQTQASQRSVLVQSQTSYTKSKGRAERRQVPLPAGDHGAWSE
jgi:hypothetical protein